MANINLCYCSVTNEAFLTIAEHCRNLKWLIASLTDIEDIGLLCIGENCKNLKEIDLVQAKSLSNKGLIKFVKAAHNLKKLSVTMSFFSRDTIEELTMLNPKLSLEFI